jgi:phospho-N-acetylmuramoyl-pentapeptide-transferase
MGGLLILSALSCRRFSGRGSTVAMSGSSCSSPWAFGLIGFADDYAKVKKQTHKGVSGKVRFAIGIADRRHRGLVGGHAAPRRADEPAGAPRLQGRALNLGILFIPFASSSSSARRTR